MIANDKILSEIFDSPQAPKILEEANRLLHEEHEKRKAFYNRITENDKAEFINGEIIIHSPVKKAHHVAASKLFKLLDTYTDLQDLGFVGYEKIMIKLTRNDYEPDLCFFEKTTASTFVPDQKIFPAPDLIVEVLSDSTEKNDRGIKFEDYQIHGVKEYWIIEPLNQIIEQYRLIDGKYNLIVKSGTGTISSEAVNGFSIAIEAIFNAKRNLEELKRIMR